MLLKGRGLTVIGYEDPIGSGLRIMLSSPKRNTPQTIFGTATLESGARVKDASVWPVVTRASAGGLTGPAPPQPPKRSMMQTIFDRGD